jgi:outer membrane lipoprotein carrier protein
MSAHSYGNYLAIRKFSFYEKFRINSNPTKIWMTLMKKNMFIPFIIWVALCLPGIATAQNPTAKSGASETTPPTIEEVIETLGNRFNAADFSASFTQESTLKAMDITDTAKGKVWFKHPGMMRWAYETPEQYAIITDGKTLWIYRPEDNQVMVGDAMTYFSNGKGASFLSNFRQVKESFNISFAKPADGDHYTLKLIPHQKQLDLSEILLNIDKRSFDIDSVVSINAYGDETRITFSSLAFEPGMDASMFHFQTPKGADVVELETKN